MATTTTILITVTHDAETGRFRARGSMPGTAAMYPAELGGVLGTAAKALAVVTGCVRENIGHLGPQALGEFDLSLARSANEGRATAGRMTLTVVGAAGRAPGEDPS